MKEGEKVTFCTTIWKASHKFSQMLKFFGDYHTESCFLQKPFFCVLCKNFATITNTTENCHYHVKIMLQCPKHFPYTTKCSRIQQLKQTPLHTNTNHKTKNNTQQKTKKYYTQCCYCSLLVYSTLFTQYLYYLYYQHVINYDTKMKDTILLLLLFPMVTV